MRPFSLRPSVALAAACLLAILLFPLALINSGVYFWGRFLIPIVVVYLWGRRRDIYIVAALASVLIAAGYWFEAAPGIDDLVVHHVLPIAVVWAAAWVLAQQKRLQEEMEAQVKARTAALAAREEQLTKIFRANPGGIAIVRRSDGGCLEANDAYLAMVGYSREEVIGHTSVELGILSAESRAEVTDALRTHGHVHGRNLQLTNARGEVVEISYSSEEIEFDGEPCYLALMVDVTAQRRMERELRDSEERFRLIVENSPDVITLFDEQGKMVYLSPAFETTHDASVKAALAADPLLLEAINAPQDDGLRAEEQISALARLRLESRRMAAEAVAYCLQHPEVKHRVEIASPLRSGEVRHFDIAYQAYRRASGDLQVMSITRDVTERKQLEDALAAGEAQLRQVNQRLALALDAASIGVWTWNFADGSLDWDERMCELYGVPPEQRRAGLYYELWRARVHPDDRDRAEPSHGDPVHSRTPWSTTFRIVLPSGDMRYIQVNAVKEYDEDGQPRRMIGVNRDVTDQVHYDLRLEDTNAELERRVAARTADLEAALAEVQAANRLKGEFMAMISHELRTPITGVLSMSELLGEQIAGPLNARQAVYVRSISESGERLLYVINNILGYTHLLSGKVQLRGERCGLGYLLHVCAVSQRAKAEAKQQVIEEMVEPEGLSIESDVEALGEVIKRLLDNAIKFTPAGGRVGLAARAGAAPGSVQLLVWDTGPGLTGEQMERLVKPFAQGDGRLARVHEGLGMGLAYVDQMVRLLGGTLEVAARKGGGSCFMITLPAPPTL